MSFVEQINLLVDVDHSLTKLIEHNNNGIIVLSEGVRRIVDDITDKTCQLNDERISVIVTRWNEIYAKYMSDKPFLTFGIQEFKQSVQEFLQINEVVVALEVNNRGR